MGHTQSPIDVVYNVNNLGSGASPVFTESAAILAEFGCQMKELELGLDIFYVR
jgi:hypothetical protein